MHFFTWVSGFETKLYHQLDIKQRKWFDIFNLWSVLGIALCSLSSAYLFAFTTNSIGLSIMVGSFVLILCLSIQAALISITSFHCAMSEQELLLHKRAPLVRSFFIFIMACILSFPIVLSAQQLLLERQVSEMKSEKSDLVQQGLVAQPKVGRDEYSTLTQSQPYKKERLVISIPELIAFYPNFYTKPYILYGVHLLIALMVAGGFILRDLLAAWELPVKKNPGFIQEPEVEGGSSLIQERPKSFSLIRIYEELVHDQHREVVSRNFEHLKASVPNDPFILGSLERPFHQRETEYEKVERKKRDLDEGQRIDFIDGFFEPVSEVQPK